MRSFTQRWYVRQRSPAIARIACDGRVSLRSKFKINVGLIFRSSTLLSLELNDKRQTSRQLSRFPAFSDNCRKDLRRSRLREESRHRRKISRNPFVQPSSFEVSPSSPIVRPPSLLSFCFSLSPSASRRSTAIPVRAYACYVARATAVGQEFDDRQPCKAGRLGSRSARLGSALLGSVPLGSIRPTALARTSRALDHSPLISTVGRSRRAAKDLSPMLVLTDTETAEKLRMTSVAGTRKMVGGRIHKMTDDNEAAGTES